MKLTKDLLIKLINEAMEHGGLSCNEVHPDHTHSEWEDHKKEEDEKTKAMAKISIKEEQEDCVPKSKLRDVLKVWMEKEYDSD